jgi:hypothetical protein
MLPTLDGAEPRSALDRQVRLARRQSGLAFLNCGTDAGPWLTVHPHDDSAQFGSG